MTQTTIEQLQALEAEIKHTLYTLIDLELNESYQEMTAHFAKLLAKVQAAQLIDYKLNVLVDPQAYGTETCILLESLLEAKNRPNKRHQLLTHRIILKIWLRKNRHFLNDFLPQMF
ncbi:hypothetical protein ACIQ1H_04210 [Lysinibacillus sp. NPDC097279]|uniref:hypothetical protein n=1 Tax=Lysinibacillus sp. NPDC097279 TaxID=3364143 RepID=UPI00380D564C